MKKKTPFLDFYFDCVETGEIPEWGLCSCFHGNDKLTLKLLEPYKGASDVRYWGYDGLETEDMDISSYDRHYKFTAMRQTIVLFCAAINGEL